jgi:hypothetical protein
MTITLINDDCLLPVPSIIKLILGILPQGDLQVPRTIIPFILFKAYKKIGITEQKYGKCSRILSSDIQETAQL